MMATPEPGQTLKWLVEDEMAHRWGIVVYYRDPVQIKLEWVGKHGYQNWVTMSAAKVENRRRAIERWQANPRAYDGAWKIRRFDL